MTQRLNDPMIQRLKERLLDAQLDFKIIGAVIFGSRVKGKATDESDLDLIVIAEGIPPKLHRRGEEIAKIKKHLPLIPIDLLLYNKEEITSNFRNHNPLFLDIANEGIVLFDLECILDNLIAETKTHIKKQNIRKFDDGWQYPLKPGIPTLL